MFCITLTAVCQHIAAGEADATSDLHSTTASANAQAQFDLAIAYFLNTQDATQDYSKAVMWFRKAAEQNHAMAQAYLGSCYANGYGVPSDHEEAVKWFRKAAEQHLAKAQNALGYCYAYGHGVPQDSKKALKWYRLAAEQNNAQSQYNLGYSYYYGQGIDQDFVEAAQWLQKSAELNYAPAQYLLGLSFSKGQGVEQNYTKAFIWWSLSARSMEEAARSRQELVARMTPQQILSAITATMEMRTRIEPYLRDTDIVELRVLAARGNVDAQLLLGNYYAEWIEPEQNMSLAIRWWTTAAEHNNAEAQFKLGNCYAEGHGVKQDFEEAVKWLRQAAMQNNAKAQYSMGLAYSKGQGVEKDYSQAAEWFRRAADLNYAPAQYQMGLCSANGQGMQTNLVSAFAWWSLSRDSVAEAASKRESLTQEMTPKQIFEGMQLSKNLKKQISIQLVEIELQKLQVVAKVDNQEILQSGSESNNPQTQKQDNSSTVW